MEDEYDVVICGTGMKECILGGLLAVKGKKILQVDRNSYYGGDSASLNLTNLFKKFGKQEPPPASYGCDRDWNVDLIPKFVMASGTLTRILLKTKVFRYLEWKVVEGTYVYQPRKGSYFRKEKYIHKVPATEYEALTSSMMSPLEKNRCRSFLSYCANWTLENTSTHKGLDPDKTTMRQLYEYFNFHESTIDFIGHAIALHTTDSYMEQPMAQTMQRIKLYMYSVSRYGKSPFIYPVYGLGTLPESFARLCAVYRGTFMLNMPIQGFVYNDKHQVCGVKASTGEIAKCRMVICDPSYVLTSSKVKSLGKIIRCICILGSPPEEAENVSSAQIILPQKQLNRRHDIYVAMISSDHCVAREGKYLALVSTTVETPEPEKEIQPALDLLGNIEHKFTQVSELYEPLDNGTKDNVYVTKSYDATSHFESATQDVLRVYKNIMGEPLDLTLTPEEEENQDE